MALFNDIDVTASPKGFASTLPKCGACGLLNTCNSPKMEVSGKGKLGILIVGEAPGADEDKRGRAFVGKAGKRLAEEFTRHGSDMREDCWITNALICRPPNNATPTTDQVNYCRPNLAKTIRELKPRVILVLGGAAVQSVIGHVWKENDIGGIFKWAGWQIPCRAPDAWICPTFHPSFILREAENHNPKHNKPYGEVLKAIYSRHIRQAIRLGRKGRTPWDGNPPDEANEVEIIHSPKEAAKQIRLNMAFNPKHTVFDYETTMLKPEGDGAEIVSCSISFEGGDTFAFPWAGVAVDAMRQYLKSEIPKGGANMKFEKRWSIVRAGVKPRGIKYGKGAFDAMQGAHVLDHRPGITSVKFQGFVLTGAPAWGEQVHPYLVADGPSVPNRIRQCPIDALLLYNGIDSLVEYRVILKQAERFGITL